MKRIFFSLLLVFGILSAFAQNQFVVDGLKYSILYRSFKTCSVVGFATADNNTKNVIIPESVTYRDVEYTVTEIGEYAFYETQVEYVSIPNTVTTIGSLAFGGSQLKSVTIPSSVIKIGNRSFIETNLKTVSIPISVTEIGYGPFSVCPYLENIFMENENDNFISVDGVLYNKNQDIILQCPGARKEMLIPESVKEIGDFSFEGCTSLSSIKIPESVIKIGNYSFQECSSLTSIQIPESVKTIGIGAFRGCSSLPAISLPDEVTYLYEETFQECVALREINLPSALLSISWWGFLNCISLESITFPESFGYVGEAAFYDCTSLRSVTCLSDKLVKLGIFVFNNLPEDAKLYVKANLIEEYENSNWAKYFSQILPLEDRPETGAVEEIEIDNSLPFDVYGLSGVLVRKNVCKENLKDIPAGIYILRQGNASKKIILR